MREQPTHARVADAVRIKLEEDRRVFTPVVARSSYDWQDYYDERSAVERVNSSPRTTRTPDLRQRSGIGMP